MAQLIEIYNGYQIKKNKDGCIIVKKGKHAHIRKQEHCRMLIDFIQARKIPKKKYFIKAVMSLADDPDYLCDLAIELHKWDGIKDCMAGGHVEQEGRV